MLGECSPNAISKSRIVEVVLPDANAIELQLEHHFCLVVCKDKMPGRPGQQEGGAGLTAAQRTALEQVVLRDGAGLGVHALYAKLRTHMGRVAPTRNEVAGFVRALPETQLARMPKSTAGQANIIAPVIPKAVPLSSV